ncbi:MAG: hypothetical protein RL168_650, partial [Bacteroidota bacterium]
TPFEASSEATVDLPAPMDPVRPMCFGGMLKGRANREFVENPTRILQERPCVGLFPVKGRRGSRRTVRRHPKAKCPWFK